MQAGGRNLGHPFDQAVEILRRHNEIAREPQRKPYQSARIDTRQSPATAGRYAAGVATGLFGQADGVMWLTPRKHQQWRRRAITPR